MIKEKQPLVCYECQSSKDLIEIDQDITMCSPCMKIQKELQIHYKNIRGYLSPEIDQIEEGIFLGNEDAAATRNIVDQKGITAICVCGSNLIAKFKDDHKFQYKIYQIADYPKQAIKHLFEDHYTWMSEMVSQKRKIMLHCAAGISRSASFTIAFLMRWKKMHLKETYAFVKSKRKYIHPNSGFLRQLQQYESQLIDKNILPKLLKTLSIEDIRNEE